MTGQRVGLFGLHDHPVLLACAAALVATGNKPLFRNENVFTPHPSQHEPFDAIVVIGDSPAAEAVMVAHEERDIQIYNIGAKVGVPDEATGEIAEPLMESSAFRQFAERINASLVQQRGAIEASLAQFGGASGGGESTIVVVGPDPDAELGRKLLAILSSHVGERGYEEGAVAVLERIITERDAFLSERTAAFEERDSAVAALEAVQNAAIEKEGDLPKVADLAAHLETLDADGVIALQARDARKTAAPLYEARLDALTKPAT